MKSRQFVDTVEALARGGHGGAGSASMRHEKFIPHGGPDGGDGGRGGDVILVGDEDVDSLVAIFFDSNLFAAAGGAGGARRMHGRNGEPLFVPVPLGTSVTDAETGIELGDIRSHGQTLVVARGGKGGFGNLHFVSPTHQAPREHGPGEPGQELRIRLDLRMMADASLVGFPSAGKSSLLRAISRAKPKVAAYPFTTLTPHIGTVLYPGQGASLRVADVPGIIEDAHLGAGLGDRFLRHIERSRVMVYVLDMAGSDARKPWDDFRILQSELGHRDPSLLERPRLVLANKMDLPEAADLLAEFRRETGEAPLPVSASTGEGIDSLKQALYDLIRPERHRRRSDVAASGEPPATTIVTIGGRKKIAPVKKKREKANHGIVTPRRGYTAPKPLPSPGESLEGPLDQIPEISAEKLAQASFLR
jgi:GTP-binding protein